MNAQAITYPPGRYNPAGTTKNYYAFVEDIATFPTLADPETATTYASMVELSAAITMKPGKQFFEIYGTIEEGELKSNVVGSRDGKGFDNSLELAYPGNDALFLGFLAAVANRTLVLITKEKNGKLRVLGSLDDPAYLDTGEYTSGKKIADARRTVATFKASGATPPPLYTETMTALLTPAA